MCKFSFIFVIVSILLLSGMTQAASIDVTAPGDTVKGIPDDGDWPGAEAPPFVIDNDTYTKYLHFKGDNETSGFRVTASLAGKVVTGMTFTTANDAPERDPVTFEISGSNVGIDGPYTLIAIGDVVDFDQVDAWPRNAKNETPISFDNDVAYDHYEVLFTTLRVPENGCCMQISEVELLTTYEIPAGCAYRDIGTTTSGYAWEIAGTYTIGAGGADIWGGSDGFGYLFRPLENGGIMKVNLASMTLTHDWAKVGLMIRENLAANSKHAMIATTGVNGCQFVYRADTGGGSAAETTSGQIPPKEMWIERDGDTLRGTFWNWVIQGVLGDWETETVDIAMNADVYIGIAVCSHVDGQLCVAVLDNVMWPEEPYNKPWLMSPENGVERMSLQPTLTWMPGDDATSHDVYLGTSPTPTDEVSVATKPFGEESYTPDTPLAEGTVYYWQIVAQLGGYEGPIYSFKTQRMGTGMIDYQLWFDMGGTAVPDMTSNPRYPDSPDVTGQITVLDSGTDLGDNYGGRAIGYLVPETSGDYTFWIASDDASELWLSTSGKGCEAVMICKVSGWTGYHNYEHNPDTEPDQESAPVYLEANQKYPIWALWKEGGGGDHCSVAWEGDADSDAPSRTEIDGYFLMPDYVDVYPSNTSPADGVTITVEEAATVSWKAGGTATSHNVYVGEDPDAMAFVDNVPMPDTSLAITVQVGKTYYWMVEADDGTNTYAGCTQSFSTAEWVSIDIGDAWGGSATQNGNCWTIIANGGDIWDNGDHFHFVYQTPTFTRDEGTVIAHVLSVANVGNSWAKAGVMIRETTASGSKNTCVLTTPSDGENLATFQWRDDTGGGSGSSYAGGVGGSPEWLKLVRNGNVFSGYHSEDGVNWQHLGDHTTYMNSFVRVGLAVTSHNWDALTTAEICDLSITTPDIRRAWGPTPAQGADWQSIHATVGWNAGEGGVAGHRVYFSNDEAAVINRVALLAGLPGDVTELDPTESDRQSLMLTETYYWAVDSVMPDGTVIPGQLWSFTVEPYRLVDDFESYDVGPEPLPEQEFVLGEVLLEAVSPPDNEWVLPQVLVEAVAPDEGCLVSRWDFEGDYTDSKSGFDGTPNGGVSLITDDPERGNVASFDGEDGSYVDCGNPDDLNFGTNDWSVCVWIKTTESDKGCPFSNGGDGGGGHRYTLGVGESKGERITLTVDDDDNKEQAHSSTHVTDGVWHHVIGIRKGGNIYIYVDGDGPQGSDDPGEAYDLSETSQREVLLGAIWHHGNDVIQKFYTGLLDDVRVYNCALTLGNIRYMSGLGDIVKPGYYGPLIAHYKFDEGDGETAIDSTDNNLDGVISGAVYTTDTADGSASCLDFNGLGDNVLNLDAGPFLNHLDELSISLWIQSDLTDTDKGFFMGSDSGSDRHGMRYDRLGGSADPDGNDVIKYGVRTNEGNEEDESSQFLQTTEWQHIVMAWKSGAGITLWINGAKDVPTFDGDAQGGLTENYNRLLVGKGSKDGDDDEGWDGRIDDVRIYARTLSEAEVRYLAGVGNIALPDWYRPLIAHYDFEAGDGTDSSGNNLHGELIGNAMVVDDALIESMVLDVDANATAETHMNCGNSDLFDTLDDQITIATWIRIRDFGGAWTKLMSNGNNSSWRFERVGSDPYVSMCFDGTNNGRVMGDMNVDDGKWHHICAVLNSPAGYSALLVDGVVDAYNTGVSGNCNTNDNEIRVGDHQNWHDRTNGWFDDVRIYDTALTLGQVRKLANYVSTNPIEGTWSSRGAASAKLNYLGVAREGSQSMRVEYTGDGAVQRLEPFGDGADPQVPSGDWTLGGTEALVIYFRGDPDNAPGLMFAQLTTTVPSGITQRVMYKGDPEDLLIPEWQEWNLELHELYTGKPAEPIPEEGLPATKIKEIGIGIFGGSGVVHFDDIRVHPTRCVPIYGPQYDLTGDCVVNMDDLRVLVGDWLDGDSTGTGLVARFEFDGDLTDSSGNVGDGTAHGAVGFEDDRGGQVLSLPGGDDQYVSIPPVGLSGNDPTTIACWAKADNTSIPDWTLVFGFTGNAGGGGGNGTHFNIGSLGGPGGIGAHVWGWEATIFTDDEALEWRHYAMAFDGSTISYYGDGALVGTVGFDLAPRADRVHVGSRVTQASSFPGKVDDARIYNRELSTAEINTVMSGVEVDPLYSPLVSVANLYDEEPVNSKKINFNDFALLMHEWLVEIYWP